MILLGLQGTLAREKDRNEFIDGLFKVDYHSK